jgi:hypothetical protein
MPHLQVWDVVIALEETTRVTPEIETGSEIHRTAHRWIDISVALCALVVSITSLGIAVHHGRTMARLVAANSWPILDFTSSRRDPQAEYIISLNVSNKGSDLPRSRRWRCHGRDAPCARTASCSRHVATCPGPRLRSRRCDRTISRHGLAIAPYSMSAGSATCRRSTLSRWSVARRPKLTSFHIDFVS